MIVVCDEKAPNDEIVLIPNGGGGSKLWVFPNKSVEGVGGESRCFAASRLGATSFGEYTGACTIKIKNLVVSYSGRPESDTDHYGDVQFPGIATPGTDGSGTEVSLISVSEDTMNEQPVYIEINDNAYDYEMEQNVLGLCITEKSGKNNEGVVTISWDSITITKA